MNTKEAKELRGLSQISFAYPKCVLQVEQPWVRQERGRGDVTSDTSAPLVSTSLVCTGLALYELRELLRAVKTYELS